MNQIQSTATINEAQGYVTNVDQAYIEQTMTSYQQQVEAYITANHPDATVGDILGKKIIQEKQNPVLFATLPYHLVVKAGQYAAVPNSLRHKVSFKVLRDQLDEYSDTYLNYTASIPELAGKKITLSYSPATPADEAVIESYLPEPHPDGTPIQPGELPQSLPAYLIQMKPELRIDGEIKAMGTPVGLGQNESFTIQFMDPSGIGNEIIKNDDVKVGEYDALVIDALASSSKRLTDLKAKLEATKAKLETQDFTNLTKDDLLGDLLFATIASYFAELDTISEITEKTQNVIHHRLPSTGRFFFSLSVDQFFGIPRSVSPNALEMDVDRSFRYSLEKTGDREKTKQFNLTVGMNSSALEHSVPEQLFSTPENPVQGVSAVKALAIANSQGIPIYQINKTNITSILPSLQLDGYTISDIRNAVNAGLEVTVQQREINFQGRMVAGYLIIDPQTGAGAYMISGGSEGALIAMDILWGMLFLVTLFVGLTGGGALVAGVFVLLDIVNSVIRNYIKTGKLNLNPILSEIGFFVSVMTSVKLSFVLGAALFMPASLPIAILGTLLLINAIWWSGLFHYAQDGRALKSLVVAWECKKWTTKRQAS